jgi:hypothetical protein
LRDSKIPAGEVFGDIAAGLQERGVSHPGMLADVDILRQDDFQQLACGGLRIRERSIGDVFHADSRPVMCAA